MIEFQALVPFRRHFIVREKSVCRSLSGGREVTSFGYRHHFLLLRVCCFVAGFVSRFQHVCSSCRGQGRKVSSTCAGCRGSGSRLQPESIQVEVPRGARSGTRILFSGMADESREGGRPGDLVVELVQEPHRLFQRAGNHLLLAVHIPLVDALSGCHVPVTAIDPKQKLALSTLPENSGDLFGVAAAVVKPGEVWVLRGQGMPLESEPTRRGDLYVRIFVDFPDQLPQTSAKPAQQEDGEVLSTKLELERILGQRSRVEASTPNSKASGQANSGGIFGRIFGSKKQGVAQGDDADAILAVRASLEEVKQLDKIWGSQQQA